jgi:hypothetical protein
MPDTSTSRATGRRHSEITLTVSLVLAGVVAILILVGSVFFQSDQKGVNVTVNQPTTESPTSGDTKMP